MDKGLLIYDPSCPFCVGLANRVKNDYGIEILPNDSKELPGYVNKSAVKKDVHYFKKGNRLMLSYKAEAAVVQIISLKHPRFARFCGLPFVSPFVGILYYVLKKSRKFL